MLVCLGSEWFQIHSSAYRKCLTVRSVSYRSGVFVTERISLSLRDCVQGSLKQNWRWTDGRLQSAFKRKCLEMTFISSYRGRIYGVSLRRCNSRRRSQQWTCTTSGYLKLKNDNLFLVPVPSRRQGSAFVSVRSTVTNSCRWSRYGTRRSLCDDGMYLSLIQSDDDGSKIYVRRTFTLCLSLIANISHISRKNIDDK